LLPHFWREKCSALKRQGTAPSERFYTINKQVLSQVEKAKYLGVMITEELDWSPHITNTVAKANKCLGFIKRNINNCPQELREMAYLSLVRSQLEYACVAWDPHKIKDITNLEKIQRKAARFVKQDYSNYSSVTRMIQELGWKNLQERRKDLRLTMLYKIVNDIANVPKEEILIPSDNRTRSEHGHKFCIPNQETNEYKYSFFPHTIPQWNCLPKALIDSDTVDTFKHRLKDLNPIA
jgi:hypothetical protein